MRRLSSAFSFVFLVGLMCVASTATYAQQGNQIDVMSSENFPLPSLAEAAISAVSALRAAPQAPPVAAEVRNLYPGADLRTLVAGTVLQQDPLLLPFTPSGPAGVLTQFDGSDNDDNVALNSLLITPPDTIGDVSSDSTDRYVQMINLVTAVFDKNGSLVPIGGTSFPSNPFPSNVFWSGMPTTCASTNAGDPVVLYDEAADRWIVSQFTAASPFLECVAISVTSDPLGAYNRYAFDFTALGFNDYPHLGITTDAIGLQINLFNASGTAFLGTWIGALDKNCMYAGGTCNMAGMNLGTSEFGHLPFDYDNSGNPGFIPVQFGTANSRSGFFDVWTVTPNFAVPSATVTRTSAIPIATYDNDLCIAARERCIPHPGSGDDLEMLGGRMMHRNQLVNHGSYLSVVAAHTIDAAAAPSGTLGRAGIRWYELRSTDGGTNWSLHQEGTHAPADTLHRWMPSIAQNARGDIALGFMTSNASSAPAIVVTGQSAGSGGNAPQIGAPGVMNVTETTCRAGVVGSDWKGRSGDYSATSVDPTSGSFWHTNEFGRISGYPQYGFAGQYGWGTAVCEFTIPPPGVYVLDGFGGVHSGGGAPVMSPATPYFGFDAARDLELAATGYYVMDGWGGMHAGGGAAGMVGPPYFGFDASADFELTSPGNVALDIFGGLHFNAGSPVMNPPTPYFGFDAARDLELAPGGGFYVFDAFGGLHFGGGATVLSPLPPYFGFDASEDIEVTPTGLYALDAFGGVHAVGGAPAVVSPPPYFGFDVARDMELAGSGMYVLDAFGGLHAANGASVVSPGPPYYGFDIAKDLEIR